MIRWQVALGLSSLISGAAAHAHHSIASFYDINKQATIEGEVSEFRFVHPHPILIIDAAADGEEPELWQLEMDNRNELTAIGISAETFKPGDRVIATGSVAKTERQRLYLRRLDRAADGLLYEQVGSRPRISGQP